MHYIIGDVHGEYDTLLALIAKLPIEAKLVFVGDLIDRGKHSSKVIELVRKYNYSCVLGNHEVTFIRFFEDYFGGMSIEALKKKWHSWLFINGGESTIASYFFWDNPNNPKTLAKIKEDIEWMKGLPLYIELDTLGVFTLPIVISHSNITHVWHHRKNPEKYKHFKDISTRTRDLSYNRKSKIFNIFGHIPQKNGVRIEENFVCIDTGCGRTRGSGKLSAYCVESGEVFDFL